MSEEVATPRRSIAEIQVHEIGGVIAKTNLESIGAAEKWIKDNINEGQQLRVARVWPFREAVTKTTTTIQTVGA